MSTIDLHPEPMILRIANAIARFIGFGEEQSPVKIADQRPKFRTDPAPKAPTLHLVAPIEYCDIEESIPNPVHKWRRHPQLLSYTPRLTAEVREARQEVVRGLYAATAGALEVATEHFTIAARCEDVDITAVPGFWSLTRGQMQTVVEAYERADRFREAAALDAHIQTIFRPSLVGTPISPVVPRKQSELAAN